MPRHVCKVRTGADRRNFYDDITRKVIAELEAGCVPCRDPDYAAWPSLAGGPLGLGHAAVRHKGHATGHRSRLNRDLNGSYGTKKYTFEELVAELSAAFGCASLGIVPTVRHADYIGFCRLGRERPCSRRSQAGANCRLRGADGGRTVIGLAEGLQLRRVRVMGVYRIELSGFTDTMHDRLRAYGRFGEIGSWKLRTFVPSDASGAEVLARLLDRYAIERIAESEAA
jgi:Zincin-like metallopeptidase